MAEATILIPDFSKIVGLEMVKLGSDGDYTSKKFAEIVGAWATNLSDDDGVSVSWSGTTVTTDTVTATDDIFLVIAGRK